MFSFFYLFEQLPEFCSRDNSLIVKEIFGVTEYASSSFELFSHVFHCLNFPAACFYSEDSEKIRLHTLSDAGDIDALEKMVEDGSDAEDYSGR